MSGIHHVTAISGKASRNIDFYTNVLGLRLVKKTVNFDDPGSYHLYFGDERGTPGTVLTFFPWEHATPGRIGDGSAAATAFRVPAESLGYWTHRFVEKGVAHQALEKRFGEPVLPFTDPDGMNLALVGVASSFAEPHVPHSDVPVEHGIRGFHGVTFMVRKAAPTAAVLTGVLGFRQEGSDGALLRLTTGAAGAGSTVTLQETGGFLPPHLGRGSVHHVAFRVTDDAQQAQMAKDLREEHGIAVTPQRDRHYFRSVYFREPGGVLFELATEDPGFAVDEPVETLGEALKLPPFLESRRREIEAVLPPLGPADKAA